MSDYYPELDVEALGLMIELQREDPGYITRGGYPEAIEDLFLGLGREPGEALPVDMDGLSKWEKLEVESNDLFAALTQAGKTLDSRDSAERMAYFRTATALMERIVGIQERALNLKRLAQFQQTVVSVMDDVLTGDQRTEVRSRLQAELRNE